MADLAVESIPTDQECRALVEKIVASKEFQKANRLRDFLLYVVDRKLARAPQEITEALIGHRVFGRPPTYNTGEDSIVRTEARLLRQRLERYFVETGAGEPIVLEIPRGSYVPVFFRRDQSAGPVVAPPALPAVTSNPAKSRRIFALSLLVCACVVAAAVMLWRGTAVHSPWTTVPSIPAQTTGSVELESSDPQLVRGFEWAKQRALGYTYTGDPVGDWYDSTAGTRYAFCMRDVSHQSIGAAVLGLARHTRNMLRRFAASISGNRDWCGFWEINKDGFPAPVDYQDDRHFWYCLPANFDVMRTCYRQFLWTGDRSYFDSVFSNFYDRSVTDYVAAWDPNRDGIMQSSPRVRPRGIASYYQEQPNLLIGGDLIAAQYTGYVTYSAIQQQKGSRGSLSDRLASEYLAKAAALRVRYNTEWWNPIQNRHYSTMLANHRFFEGYVAEPNLFALLFGLTEEGLKTESALDSMEKNRPEFHQKLSYYPEILFHYGRNESGYRYLLELTDPNFPGRGMPEVVFAAVGATATGLMGISPDARLNIVGTLPGLPNAVEWVKLARVPVLQNEIAVWHRGLTETAFTNQAGPPLVWKASFPFPPSASHPHYLVLDGKPVQGRIEEHINRQSIISVSVPVNAGQTRTVTLK
ncbi:MAG TPA: hypothetical protein VFB14_28775 [Bryobacteraceae bacterium]|jgi:hypothetical protein|nr:hypothetical protein [Bryobacteraceae bacterium]